MQSSFIPHDTANPARPVRSSGGGLNELLLICAIVLCVASVALAVAVFLYVQFLQTQATSKVAQLQTAEAAFEPSLIEQLTRLDDRMQAASTILSAHIAPSLFFSALDQATLKTVSFQTLDFEVADAQHITVKMQGIAQSVNSIALEANLFGQNAVIADPIFSNITRQSDGVHFDLTASVNPSAINYSNLANSTSQPAATSPLPTTTASTINNTPAAPSRSPATSSANQPSAPPTSATSVNKP